MSWFCSKFAFVIKITRSLAINKPLRGWWSGSNVNYPLRNQTVNVYVSDQHAVCDIVALLVFSRLANKSHNEASRAHSMFHFWEAFVYDAFKKYSHHIFFGEVKPNFLELQKVSICDSERTFVHVVNFLVGHIGSRIKWSHVEEYSLPPFSYIHINEHCMNIGHFCFNTGPRSEHKSVAPLWFSTLLNKTLLFKL